MIQKTCLPHIFRRFCLFSALVILVSAHMAEAAPYPPDGLPVEWRQPDGTVLSLRVFGDEFYARTETESGQTVIFDKAENAYFYAEVSDDETRLESTGLRVGSQTANSAPMQKARYCSGQKSENRTCTMEIIVSGKRCEPTPSNA